jgi:hypothetical protein
MSAVSIEWVPHSLAEVRMLKLTNVWSIRVSKIYDLKGSVRNRLVQATGKENQVLWADGALFQWGTSAETSNPQLGWKPYGGWVDGMW